VASTVRLALAAISLFSLLVAVCSTVLDIQGPSSDGNEAIGESFAQPPPPGIRLLPRAGNAEAAADSRLTGVIPVLFPAIEQGQLFLPGVLIGGNINPIPALGSAIADPRTNQRATAQGRALPPVEVKIPRINVDAKVIPVKTTELRQVDTPEDAATIAWYSEGVAPGENGVAMLAGHRDWAGVKGSFYGLSSLRLGDTISTVATDGTETHFVVWQSESYPTSNAPAGEILRQDGPPSLVLVSCEGAFDTVAHDYTHRRVVLAIPPGLAG
jgi:sortase (surface protein transpeptidase)